MRRPAVFDTNIFVYADDTSEPLRQARAIQLITTYQSKSLMVVSIQVLQEYFARNEKTAPRPRDGAT